MKPSKLSNLPPARLLRTERNPIRDMAERAQRAQAEVNGILEETTMTASGGKKGRAGKRLIKAAKELAKGDRDLDVILSTRLDPVLHSRWLAYLDKLAVDRPGLRFTPAEALRLLLNRHLPWPAKPSAKAKRK